MVLTGNNTYPSSINFPNGNGKTASLTLSPPLGSTNPWQGVALFQDPKLTNTDNKWGPGADFSADGLVYLPNSNVVTDGNTSSSNAKCSKFVMNSFVTNGSVNLDFDQIGCELRGDRPEAVGRHYRSSHQIACRLVARALSLRSQDPGHYHYRAR